MNVVKTELKGALIFEPRVFADNRGYFFETWSKDRYIEAGIAAEFVQDNVSFSQAGTLRGLHYQHPHGQGKLVQVLQGEVFDVAVDIRVGSPTFGKWIAVTLTGENHKQFYVPAGFAHGFCVLSETALFSYKCTDTYHPEAEGGVIWNDPDIGIEWPIEPTELSGKDGKYTELKDIPESTLPKFGDYI